MNSEVLEIWKGPWIFDRGVGLKMKGYPTNEEEFIKYLAGHSCHPVASRRILKRLKEVNKDRLTVMPHLPFAEIARDLKKMGVVLTIVKPQRKWYPKYDENPPYPEEYLPERIKKIL